MGILDTLSRFGMAKLPNVAGPATNPTAVNTGGLLGGLSRSLFAPGFRDRLALAGAQLQDIDDGGGRARQMQADAAERAQAEQQAQARAALNAALLGTRAPQMPGAKPNMAAGMNAPVQATGGATGGQSGVMSIRDAAPALIAASQAGIDVGDLTTILDRAGPDMQVDTASGLSYDARGPVPERFARPQVINGLIVDTGAPSNLERFIPDVGPGQELFRDSQGRPVVRDILGYNESLAAREGSVTGAREAAQAPYRFVNVQGPNGEPMTIAVSQAQGGAFMGQSSADQVYAETDARNRAEADQIRRNRGSAASRMIPTLANMEALLPNVIAGIGSDARRIGNAVFGALGNEGAQQRVTSTQTFQNEARQIVSQIIQSFGANPTEGERRYAEQMSGADVEYTPQALAEGARLTRQRAARDIEAAGGSAEGLGTIAEGPNNTRVIWNGFDWVPL
jgi:hypothetical protein